MAQNAENKTHQPQTHFPNEGNIDSKDWSKMITNLGKMALLAALQGAAFALGHHVVHMNLKPSSSLDGNVFPIKKAS